MAAPPAVPLPNLTLHADTDKAAIKPYDVAKSWLEAVETRFTECNLNDLSELFIDDCWWRDFVGLSWGITTMRGLSHISQYLQDRVSRSGISQLKVIDEGALQPRLSDIGGLVWIESGFAFETKHGHGRGILRLINLAPSKWKAWIIHTSLDELKGYPETSPQASAHVDIVEDLQVLIVGAGKGIILVAQPAQLISFRTLRTGTGCTFESAECQVIDRGQTATGRRLMEESIQDKPIAPIPLSFADTTQTIKSHTPKYSDHFAYLQYPDDYPHFLERDRLADWMEHYQKVMGLNVELGVTVESFKYDSSSRQWTVAVQHKQGTRKTLHPRHVILATGLLSDTPVRPSFDNENSFRGQIYHSSKHKSAALTPDIGQRRVVLIGSSSSAHDIAQDFVECGAKEVTMIQRSPMFVLSGEAQDKFIFTPWQMLRSEDADLVGGSFPLPIALTMITGATHLIAQHDKDMLRGLEEAGMALKRGEDGVGLLHNQALKGGHFYIEQGASQMIIDGQIKIRQCEEGVKGFSESGVVLADGREIEADTVVVATGFQRATDCVERTMGKEILDKVGDFGGLDDEGERIGVSPKVPISDVLVFADCVQWWSPTGVPGFWYMTGSFLWSRQFSKPLALQIKAVEEGLNAEYYA